MMNNMDGIRVMILSENKYYRQMTGFLVSQLEGIEVVDMLTDLVGLYMYLKSEEVDIVLLDMNLVDKGSELFKIKQSNRGLKIIGLTGYEEKVYLDIFYQSGADYILHKDFSRLEFIDLILEIANSSFDIPCRKYDAVVKNNTNIYKS